MLTILISSGLLILIIILLRRLTKGRISATLRYALWLPVLLRLLLPFEIGAFSFSFSSMSREAIDTVQRWTVQLEDSADPVIPEGHGNAVTNQPHGLALKPSGEKEPVKLDVIPVPQISEEIPQITETASVEYILNLVWAIGAAGMAIWLVAVNLVFQRSLRKNTRRLTVADCSLPVYLNEGIPSACLSGILRPTVYVNREDDSLRHVLAHELTHYKHWDHIWTLLRGLCLCVYWFHPLVWWAAILSRQDCELACDEGAIKRLGEGERIPYGETLMKMVSRTSKGRMLTSVTMAEPKERLKERMCMILKRTKTRRITAILLTLCLILTMGCAFTGNRDAETTEEPSMQTDNPQVESTESTESVQPDRNEHEPEEPELVTDYWRNADGTTRIPQINLDDPYASRVNREIQKLFHASDLMTGSASEPVTYQWTVWNNILSLMVQSNDMIYTYNLRAKDGTMATDNEVFAAAGLYQVEYRNASRMAVFKQLAFWIAEKYATGEDVGFDGTQVKEALKKIWNETYGLWFSEGGTVHMSGKIYFPDGTEWYFSQPLDNFEAPEINIAEPRVIELYHGQSKYTSNTGEFSDQRIPFLLMAGETAVEINAEIFHDYLMQPESFGLVRYEWYLRESVLSLAIIGQNGDVNTCLVHNVDVRLGVEVSYDAIYEPFGYSGEEYRALVRKALIHCYYEEFGPHLNEDVFWEESEELVRQSLEDENVRRAIPYVNAEGKLSVCGFLYQIAGATGDNYLIPLTDYEPSAYIPVGESNWVEIIAP